MSTASRRNSVACLSMLYHFMPICNIVINSQPGRKSEAALLDAFLFSCCQFFFNRSLNTRASAHSNATEAQILSFQMQVIQGHALSEGTPVRNMLSLSK